MSKVGSYQFTTLEPALGDMHGFILADIPGLIEGAHEGRGLGDKFLRHIKRTRILIHCLSLENEDLLKSYDAIRGELEAYDPILAKKREIVLLTKTDVLTNLKDLDKAVKKISKRNKEVYSLSILDEKSVKNFRDELVKILRQERERPEEEKEIPLEKEFSFE